MPQTLEQRRAQVAWERARLHAGKGKEYLNLAKGAPALVMGNGLMPALAYWKSRGKDHAGGLLAGDVLCWLSERLDCPAEYGPAMVFLQRVDDSRRYMLATEECLEFLKWLRQFAASQSGAN